MPEDPNAPSTEADASTTTPDTTSVPPTVEAGPDGVTTQARAVVDMLRAHNAYPHDFKRADKVTCSGIRDPQTGRFCQFVGTPVEHYEHQIGRVQALLSPGTATEAEPSDG